MCGTPNNGSPFGKVDAARKILTVLTTIAMNFAPAVTPVVGLLLNRSKNLTPTLEQMNPASEFITTLNKSGDPGVRYTILAGDVDTYKEPNDQFFDRLLTKAGQGVVFDAVFAGKANDIAVGVESILGLGGERSAAPDRRNVACHHLNYFASEAGRQALSVVRW
jgi:hypothetical protein